MEASQAEKNVFGADVKLHPITKMPLEQGKGALSHDDQARLHVDIIHTQQGESVADEMRKKLGIPTRAEREAAAKAKAEAEAKRADHEARIAELEAQLAAATSAKEE